MVIGVELDGIAKAYPVSLLNRREMVNDQLAQLPILVAWWPLCATAMVHRREIDGRDILFGNHRALLGSAMTWWDHETGSIWSQPLGEAVAGPHKGKKLALLPSQLTSWGTWRVQHPTTLALDAPGHPSSFELDTMNIVMEIGDEGAAYAVDTVRKLGVVNDVVAGVPVAVVVD